MSHSNSYDQIERRIGQIKTEISKLGPLRPGTLSKQYNVCGRPDCCCKGDPPRKHGPYYKITYSWHRRYTSEFVREVDIARVRGQLDSYQRLRVLVDEWLALGLERARLEREERKNSGRKTSGKGAPARKSKATRSGDVTSRPHRGRR
jgi:hypothetical protein